MTHSFTSSFDQLQSLTDANAGFEMNQDEFRIFYESTARPLWVFLWRRTGNGQLADDLLQDAYYRFLKARGTYESDAHRRNFLFRVAANLATDAYRAKRPEIPLVDEHQTADPSQPSQTRTDVRRAMAKLPPRQQDALWMAYAEGSSHEEIATVLGVKTASVKLMLFRARRKLAELLKK